MSRLGATSFAFALVFLAFGAAVRASEPALPRASYAQAGDPTLMPYGWYDFCRRRPEECDVPKLAPAEIRLTRTSWLALNEVNRYVNRVIVPESNYDHWGTTLDHWDYPTDGRGDCKVYALYKRKLLEDYGFPRQALLMTIVDDLHGEGHAILTIVTDRGEFALDNLTNAIRPWDATGYRYLKRQSQQDPNVWLDLGGVRGPGVAVAFAK